MGWASRFATTSCYVGKASIWLRATGTRGYGWLVRSTNILIPRAKAIAGIVGFLASVATLYIAWIALQLSQEANAFSKSQTSIAAAESQVMLTVVTLAPIQRNYPHNSPAAFAPRLRIVSGVIKGSALSNTICSHFANKERDGDGHGTMTSVHLVPNEDANGDVCEYQMGTETYSDGYELNRKVYGTVSYEDRQNRRYLYSWCRYYVREKPLPWPLSLQLTSCGDVTSPPSPAIP